MSEVTDSTIRLFGKTIQLPKNQVVLSNEPSSQTTAQDSILVSLPTTLPKSNSDNEQQACPKETSEKEITPDKQEDSSTTISSEVIENRRTPSVDRETSPKTSQNGDLSETVSQEKSPKKPEKILPCPRCNSMDTKFCYYNNYNINQPRHFCKNCQRYWTAGGTTRSVPVGSGRRKNKSSSASNYRHTIVSENLDEAQVNSVNGVHFPNFGHNGTVLTFGSNSPHCNSASVLKLSEKTQDGFQLPQERVIISSGGDNGDDHDHSSRSTVTASISSEKGSENDLQEQVPKSCQPYNTQVPCFPGPPWPYTWNSSQWGLPIPPPPFCPTGFPVSFYPGSTYWGCTLPGSWNVQCLSAPLSSGSNSSSLGKHSRDGEILSQTNSQNEETVKENGNSDQKSLWMPKTLRIDDPSEAAMSSIWATLGIKTKKVSSVNGEVMFKSFEPKGNEENKIEKSRLLQANPAALSRSLNFHESA